jgi:hypothetical protein
MQTAQERHRFMRQFITRTCILLFIFADTVNAHNTCTKASIAGSYGFTISGVVVNSDGSFYSVAEAGTLTADGNGHLTGSDTNSQGGQAQSQTFTGTFTANSDCTGRASTTDSLGTTGHFNIVIVDDGQQILFIESDAGVAVSGSAKRQATNCTTQTISGPYGYAITGWTYDSCGNGWGFAESGKVVADGTGGLSLEATVSQTGNISNGTSSGNYSVNADCTGTATFNNSAHLDFVIVDSGREVQFVQTDTNTTVTGSAEQLFPQESSGGIAGGSMAQVASGGGWQTTFTLANTGTSSAQVQLSFFDDNGNALSLPLTLVQSGSRATTSTLSETIEARATLVVLTQSNAVASMVGSAQLATTGSVSGFAIFRYNPTGQEAVVPLETRNADGYVLAFDNTNGIATGVALANISSQAAEVPITLRDNTGAVLGTATINLAARGHTSFVLTSRYVSVAGKRGTAEFDTPAGGQISVLGLRVTPTGAATTIPVLAK